MSKDYATIVKHETSAMHLLMQEYEHDVHARVEFIVRQVLQLPIGQQVITKDLLDKYGIQLETLLHAGETAVSNIACTADGKIRADIRMPILRYKDQVIDLWFDADRSYEFSKWKLRSNL